MRAIRARDISENERLIRLAYMTASFTGAVWAGKLEPIGKYLPTHTEEPKPQRSDGFADYEEL